ncbi:UNVERIFIED_CONTAM: Trigger factor-like protein TIG, Chloroplastic [Sesamum radiatum]|uniref:peptidylprolyl isomerase n=1 Tax=Sesamum radiatum TaxID=300843 RepID=A0AAW2LP57_SESRA
METCATSPAHTFLRFNPSPSLSPFPPSLSFLNVYFLKPIKIPLPHCSRQFSRFQCPSRGAKLTRFLASAAPATADDVVAEKLPADIQVTETPEPNSRVRLSVEVPAAVCDDCYRTVIKEFTKRSKVPGFRPGKNVPESILIGLWGKENVKKATIESILKRTLPHAMSSVSGRALEDSVRISTKFPEMESTYSSMKSLRYDVIVDVVPEVKWIPEDGYKNLKIVVEIDKEIDAQTAAEQELRRRHKALGALRIVTDRGLQVGDVAILDISATTIEQDESAAQSIPSAESKGSCVMLMLSLTRFQFDTEDGDKVLPDFLDSIIGIKRGETKSFPYTFPDSWKQEDLRGVRAQFTVKETLLQKFLEVEQTAKEQATDNAILDQLHKMVEVDIPPSLFEEQGRQLYGAQLLQIQANMKLNEQQLASLSSPKAVKEYLENQKDNITNIIKQNLAVGDIFKRENLQILTDELVKEVENSISEFKRHNQDYDEGRVKNRYKRYLREPKCWNGFENEQISSTQQNEKSMSATISSIKLPHWLPLVPPK